MDSRQKELKALYKLRKPQMGLIRFLCIPTGQAYLGWSTDTKATINGMTFQLDMGSCFKKNLQADWKTYGKEQFEVCVLESLPYDGKDPNKTDYTEELELLLLLWLDKLPGALRFC